MGKTTPRPGLLSYASLLPLASILVCVHVCFMYVVHAYVCVPAEARQRHQGPSSVTLLLYPVRHSLSLNLELQFVQLTMILLCLPPIALGLQRP